MDKFEKMFTEQHEAFEEEPLEGHLARFDARLDQLHSSGSSRVWPFMKIASLIIIVLLSANLIMYLVPSINTKAVKPVAVNDINEAAHFYTVRINSGLSQLKQMADQGLGSEQELEQIKKEMAEMDRLHQDLQKEYANNPSDERLINAMIAYYQTKLSIINTIKSDLENIKTSNTKKHENTNL